MNLNIISALLALAPPPASSQTGPQPNPIMAFLPLVLLIAIVFIFVRRRTNKLQAGINGAIPKSDLTNKLFADFFISVGILLAVVMFIACLCFSTWLAFCIIIFGLVGKLIGARKGRAGAGFLFGALLGPIGWIIIFVGPDLKTEQEATRLKKCPFCAELVQPDAKVCKHCGRDITPDVAQPAPALVTPKPVLPTPISEKTTANSQIPCPQCGHGLLISTLKQGENWCSSCFQKFIVE